MESSVEIKIGQVAKSKSGRDKNRVFLVCEILENDYVNVVDGKLRKLDKPKKKKIKHLSFYNEVISELEEKISSGTSINNAYIRKLLEPFE